MNDGSIVCDACGQTVILGEWPWCPHGHGSYTAVGDECDVVQENGFRHPTRFRSKQALKQALGAKGLETRVQHVPLPGSDKSPFTTRWASVDLDAAKALLDPARRVKTTTMAEGDTLNVRWETTVRE